MKVCFKGIGEQVVTFFDGGIAAGQVCKISANGQVDVCSAGDGFAGLAVHAGGGFADVQVRGYVTLPYTGAAAPALGWCGLAADGGGGVKADEDGRSYLVAEVDAAAKTVGLFL